MIEERMKRHEDALSRTKQGVSEKDPPRLATPGEELDGSEIIETGVAAETIKELAQKIAVIPHDFNINPKMVGQLARLAKMGEGTLPVDWAFAEAVAFGSSVLDGTRVRLSGQDSG